MKKAELLVVIEEMELERDILVKRISNLREVLDFFTEPDREKNQYIGVHCLAEGTISVTTKTLKGSVTYQMEMKHGAIRYLYFNEYEVISGEFLLHDKDSSYKRISISLAQATG